MSSAYSRFHRTLEISAISLFGAFAGGLAWKLATTLDGSAAWIVLGASIVTGYVVADLVSGIGHWLADRYGSETMPLLGTHFIRPFREHHLDPKAIAQHYFIETNGSNCIASAPLMALVFFSLPMMDSLVTIFVLGATLAFSLAIFATNQFHKWAHMAAPPRAAQLLRKCSLILTPEHHDLHHEAPFDRNYCITVGWWNPLLDGLRLFERIEACLTFVRGTRPAEVQRSS